MFTVLNMLGAIICSSQVSILYLNILNSTFIVFFTDQIAERGLMIDGTVLMILIVLSKFIIFAMKQALSKIKKIRSQRGTFVQFSRGGRTAAVINVKKDKEIPENSLEDEA